VIGNFYSLGETVGVMVSENSKILVDYLVPNFEFCELRWFKKLMLIEFIFCTADTVSICFYQHRKLLIDSISNVRCSCLEIYSVGLFYRTMMSD